MNNNTPVARPAARPSARPGAAPAARKVQVTPVSPSTEHLGKLCSICGTGILQSDTIAVCPVCSLPYHHDCWKEIGGCGTYGCSAAPVATIKEAVAEDVFTPGWTAEKKCPECGSSILANALVCKVCRSVFPTERPMTKSEWQNRVYNEKEIERIKISVIAQFIFSTIGCMFMIMLPVNLLTHFTDSGLFVVRRLPPTLKVLFYAALIISLVWTVLAISFMGYSVVTK